MGELGKGIEFDVCVLFESSIFGAFTGRNWVMRDRYVYEYVGLEITCLYIYSNTGRYDTQLGYV